MMWVFPLHCFADDGFFPPSHAFTYLINVEELMCLVSLDLRIYRDFDCRPYELFSTSVVYVELMADHGETGKTIQEDWLTDPRT